MAHTFAQQRLVTARRCGELARGFFKIFLYPVKQLGSSKRTAVKIPEMAEIVNLVVGWVGLALLAVKMGKNLIFNE